MDGVIVDTEPVHHYAYHQHFKQLGIEITPEMYATFTGNSTKNVYQRIKDTFGLPHEVQALVQGKRDLFNQAFDTKEDLDLLAGVRNLIEDLHQNNVQLILATSSAKVTINRIFTRFGLFPYFSHIVSGEDFPKSKPDPSIFIHAASLSVAPKEECIIIEDSTNGIKAAKGAGMQTIIFTNNDENIDSDLADFKILNFNTALLPMFSE